MAPWRRAGAADACVSEARRWDAAAAAAAAAARRLAAAGGVVEVGGCGEEECAAFALGLVTRGYATRLAARLVARLAAGDCGSDPVHCVDQRAGGGAVERWFIAMAVVWSVGCCGGLRTGHAVVGCANWGAGCNWLD